MKLSLIILLVFFAALLITVAVLLLHFQRLQTIGQTLARAATPFERPTPEATPRILIIGDSTAVGVGTTSAEESVAGMFGKDFPSAHIRNVGKSGLRVAGLPGRLTLVNDEHYDLMVVLIGGNDVVRLTKYSELEHDLESFLVEAKRHATTLVLLSPGNVGDAPIFPRPIGIYVTNRANRLRQIFAAVATRQHVLYVDPFLSHKEDYWLKNRTFYYGADSFHPRGGYGDWYQQIRAALNATPFQK